MLIYYRERTFPDLFIHLVPHLFIDQQNENVNYGLLIFFAQKDANYLRIFICSIIIFLKIITIAAIGIILVILDYKMETYLLEPFSDWFICSFEIHKHIRNFCQK